MFDRLVQSKDGRDQRRRSKETLERETCWCCGKPAVVGQKFPPQPGFYYQHIGWVCEDHIEVEFGKRDRGQCSYCHGTYGSCGCFNASTAQYWLNWEASRKASSEVIYPKGSKYHGNV
jgi:hypothetical protein